MLDTATTRRERAWLVLGVLGVLASVAAGAPLRIDPADTTGHTFDGIGGLSGGGATSVLLPDYPEQERSEVLDFLFKPDFGFGRNVWNCSWSVSFQENKTRFENI